jgi:2-polyprenyl-3-methyl-5-hydroxy-6-metoxy-1,4-benzoquinol methylase
MESKVFNETKSEAFAGRILDMMNAGSLSVMTSIGHRTGLFDAMKNLEPTTSKQVAEYAGLSERYVREWLNAMAVGRIIDVYPNGSNGDGPLYSLPAEHAVLLTREAGPDNLAVFTQYLSLMGSIEDKIVESFRNGNGVPYTEYKRFHEVMAEESELSVVSMLTDKILPLITGITEKLEAGIEVLDIGCGQGRAINRLGQIFPNSRFTGYDLSEEAIFFARSASMNNNAANVFFEVLDLTTFDVDAPEKKYDLITSFDAIHDQARPDRVLAGIFKALKDDGVYLMVDIAGSSHVHKNCDHPAGPFLYTVSTLHCMPVSLAYGGMGLGTMWGKEKAVEMLNEAGFQHIDVNELDHDFINYYYVIRK